MYCCSRRSQQSFSAHHGLRWVVVFLVMFFTVLAVTPRSVAAQEPPRDTELVRPLAEVNEGNNLDEKSEVLHPQTRREHFDQLIQKSAQEKSHLVPPLKKSEKNAEKKSVGQLTMNLGETGSQVFKGFLYVVGGFLLIIGLLQRFQKRDQKAQEAAIEIEAKKAVTAKSALIIARVEGNRYLLSASPEGLSLIAPLETRDSFSQRLSEQIERTNLESRKPADGMASLSDEGTITQ